MELMRKDGINNNMEKGDFIRHTTDGIQKITDIVFVNESKYVRCANNCEYKVKNVLNTSSDPISLIEERDYINGHLVVKKYNDKQFLVEEYKKPDRVLFISADSIETVLTKEQYRTHMFVMNDDRP